MTKITALGIIILMLIIPLTGCTGITSGITGSTTNEEIQVPTWEIGDYWLYTFSTPDYSDDTTKLVVATTDIEEEGTAYMLSLIHI